MSKPIGGDPVFGSPFSEGDEVTLPPVTFFMLQENGDKMILEDGSGFIVTEMAA